MTKQYYALYKSTQNVLVFNDKNERDTFVCEETLIHPDCIRASFNRIQDLIRGKVPVYDSSFGCLAVLAN